MYNVALSIGTKMEAVYACLFHQTWLLYLCKLLDVVVDYLEDSMDK